VDYGAKAYCWSTALEALTQSASSNRGGGGAAEACNALSCLGLSLAVLMNKAESALGGPCTSPTKVLPSAERKRGRGSACNTLLSDATKPTRAAGPVGTVRGRRSQESVVPNEFLDLAASQGVELALIHFPGVRARAAYCLYSAIDRS